ncbi:MAG: choice-of-anchor J domain-containing protein, partial [Bacteroidales bacterium]|nr:choice-of-anchor J domain-containing protein [Bacteroidales bacterium]
FGACAYSTSAPNNDWFILPRILVQGNATFSFWARSFNSSFLESFKVMISTTGNTYSDFIQLPSANYSNIATTWTQYTYNLQNYAGQNVYLAIVCTSNDKYLFGIDDIQVVAGAVTPTKDANFTADNTNISVGGTVHFTDQSTVNGTTITGRSWEFPGGTPASSTATNPSIVYNTVGTYNVSLTITTGAGNDTETKNGYITVSTGGTTMTSFTYDFEACANFVLDNFSPCETYDGDGKATYSSENFDFTNEGYTGSYIAMNPSATTPSMSGNANWAAHLGNKYGACFSAIAPPNNDWFILPKLLITTNSEFSFWAKSVTNQYELERFDVLISSNNEQFSIISAGAYIEAPTTWTKYTYSLSSYAGQEMYLAIRCVSNNAFVFAIDDISVSSTMIVAENLNLPNINVFPNPSIGEFTVLAPEKSVISIYDISGKHIQTLTSSNATTNIHIQVAGVYFVNIKTEKGIKTERLIVE